MPDSERYKKYKKQLLQKITWEELETGTGKTQNKTPPVFLRSPLLSEMEEEKEYSLSDTISHKAEEKNKE